MIQPRFIRKRDAPSYLGMCEREFVRTVEPRIVAVPIGQQGVAYDRYDLDEIADQLKAERGYRKIDGQRVPVQDTACDNGPCETGGKKAWHGNKSRAYTAVVKSGISTNRSKDTVDYGATLAERPTQTPG